MEYPLAVQHTKAAIALTMTRYIVEVFAEGTHEPQAMALVNTCQTLVNKCRNQLKNHKHKLSAGARRARDTTFKYFSKQVSAAAEFEDENEQRVYLAALWWVVLSAIISVNIVCPAFCNQTWHDLEDWLGRMGDKLEEHLPGCGELGTKLYMDMPL